MNRFKSPARRNLNQPAEKHPIPNIEHWAMRRRGGSFVRAAELAIILALVKGIPCRVRVLPPWHRFPGFNPDVMNAM